MYCKCNWMLTNLQTKNKFSKIIKIPSNNLHTYMYLVIVLRDMFHALPTSTVHATPAFFMQSCKINKSQLHLSKATHLGLVLYIFYAACTIVWQKKNWTLLMSICTYLIMLDRTQIQCWFNTGSEITWSLLRSHLNEA